MQTPSASPPPNYEWLDGARGVAAQAVLFSHVATVIFPGSAMARPGSALYWSAVLAVICFFVLSGFVITRSIVREVSATGRFDWLGYGVRRIARIYPPYLAALALVALIGPVVASHLDDDLWQWPRSILFLFTGRDAVSLLDGPVWSLRIEVGLYVVAALMASTLVSSGMMRALTAVLAIAAALTIGLKLSYGFTALALFGFGAAAAIWPSAFPRWLLAGLPAIAAPVFWPEFSIASPLSLVFQAALGVPIAALLVYLTRRPTARSTSSRIIIASGAWSYTLYILHYPLLLLIALATSGYAGHSGIFADAGIFVSVVVAINAISYLVALKLERPAYFSSAIKQWLRPKPAVAER